MSETLHVIARLRARPGKEADLRSVLHGLLAPTHAEDGCLEYRMLENVENPADFTFVERWTGPAALDAHFQTEHIRRALDRFPDLLAEELDLRRYGEVD